MPPPGVRRASSLTLNWAAVVSTCSSCHARETLERPIPVMDRGSRWTPYGSTGRWAGAEVEVADASGLVVARTGGRYAFGRTCLRTGGARPTPPTRRSASTRRPDAFGLGLLELEAHDRLGFPIVERVAADSREDARAAARNARATPRWRGRRVGRRRSPATSHLEEAFRTITCSARSLHRGDDVVAAFRFGGAIAMRVNMREICSRDGRASSPRPSTPTVSNTGEGSAGRRRRKSGTSACRSPGRAAYSDRPIIGRRQAASERT